MRIVVLSAFQDELTSILNLFSELQPTLIHKSRCWKSKWDQHEIVISLTGIGTTASAITTTSLCQALEPDLIIFCGVAGGLKPHQVVGDLVLARKIIDADLYQLPAILKDTPYKNALIDPHHSRPIVNEYPVHDAILETLSSYPFDGLQIGKVVTSNTFPAPKDLFETIKNLDCSAIEMESSGVFKAAEYYDVPVITIRAISNLLDAAGNDLGTHPNALAICADKLSVFLSHILQHTAILDSIAEHKQQQKILDIVNKHQLIQHPEGGWYRRTFKSQDLVKTAGETLDRYAGESRAAGSSIIYLLPQGDCSAWHTVQSDETWFFHEGDPLLLRVIEPSSGHLHEVVLGNHTADIQFTVKAGHVFAAESQGRYSLVSCAVTPGFEFKDFQLLSCDEFSETYPQHRALIRLTRDKSAMVSKSSIFKEEQNHTNHNDVRFSPSFS